MSEGRCHTSDRSNEDLFTHRCEALKLPLWQGDARGCIVSEPRANGQAGKWFDLLRERIQHAAFVWADESDPQPIEILRGGWLLPFVTMRGAQRLNMMLVLAASTNVTEDERFRSICEQAGDFVGGEHRHGF